MKEKQFICARNIKPQKDKDRGDLSVAYHHSPVLNCEVSQISMKFIDYGNKQFSKVFLTFFLYIKSLYD